MSQQSPANLDRLLTDRQVAEIIGCARSWPWKLAREGRFPTPIKLSNRCTRWRSADVAAWLDDPQAWQRNAA